MFATRTVLIVAAVVATAATTACSPGGTATTSGTSPSTAASSSRAPANAGIGAESADPTTKPTVGAPAIGKPVHGRLGTIISTGLDASQITEWVIYGVPVANKYTPDTTFGFQLSERENDGTLNKDLVISEVGGRQLAPGFHAVEGAAELEGHVEQPAFGYFVGAPAKITGTVAGRTVIAKTAKWSADNSVTVFWFDNRKVTGRAVLNSVSAFGAGNELLAQTKVNLPA